MAIEPSEAKVTVVAKMITTVDVFDAEILSELQDWQGLGQLIDVSFLVNAKDSANPDQDVQKRIQLSNLGGGKGGHCLETIADLLSQYPDCPIASERRKIKPTRG